MAYASLSEIKEYLGISASSDDSLLTDMLTRAQAIIEAGTGRLFEASSHTQRFFDALADVEGLTLFLDHDLAALNTITNGDAGATTITSAQYVTEPRNETPFYAIRLLESAGVSWAYAADPENAITISGKWAYAESAPADIVQATIRLAAFLYRQKESNADVDRPLQLADGSVVLPSGLPRDVLAIIRRYRRG